MDYRSADPQLQLDVDKMTLDYLLHKGIQIVLAERLQHAARSRPDADLALQIVDSFLKIFRASHPTHTAPPALQYGSRLLRFATLFCRRACRNSTTPSLCALAALRRQNKARAQRWRDKQASTRFNAVVAAFDSIRDVSFSSSHQSHHNPSHGLPPSRQPFDNQDYNTGFQGSEESIHLLDISPSFMALSASRAVLDSDFTITRRWVVLACDFMLQAASEQYLRRGAKGSDAVTEAFAWGYMREEDDVMDLDVGHVPFEEWSPEEVQVNEMSQGGEDEDAEVAWWGEVRDETFELLEPKGEEALVEHLENVAAFHPFEAFETSIRSFSNASAKSVPGPVLVQLEHGRSDGLSEVESAAFMRKVGLAAGM